MSNSKQILPRGFQIDKTYKVAFFLKKGSYAETYRVIDNENNTRFLKLFFYSKLHRTQFDSDGHVLEIEILKKINHPNLISYIDDGEFIKDNQKYAYVVLEYISGETLADKMIRQQEFNIYEAKDILRGILDGLNYLHSNQPSIIHNDITNLNVMLDLSGVEPVPKIIDFGYARYLTQSHNDFLQEGLNPFYMSNEVFNGVFSPQSDIFSVGALLYHIMYGLPPWFFDLSDFQRGSTDFQDALLGERSKPLSFPTVESSAADEINFLIEKALETDVDNRFKSCQEFLSVLNGDIKLEMQGSSKTGKPTKPEIKNTKGEGFKAIAGMAELKEMIKTNVIDALQDREKYASYGLNLANGMLLYGPPGCGKTFFAEKMAEEIGFQFFKINPSDIQSKWVNASQENIKNLFDTARKHAPSIIFIDEIDALVPNRDNDSINHMNSSAVNEFLAQINNCGIEGLFVVGATNRPHAIDPAILRAGRLEKHIYLPPPDMNARIGLFKIHLKNRPLELGIDYEKLGQATEYYVASDIKLICDEAARKALKSSSRITEELILETINQTAPTVSKKELLKYRKWGDDDDIERPTIGFK